MIEDSNTEELNKLTYLPEDTAHLRKNIFSKVKSQIEKSFPLNWGGLRLEAKNINIENEDKEFSLKEQKDALLQDKYLSKKLKADLYLYDDKTNTLLDTLKNKTIMNVPYYTQRGTFEHNGNEYTSKKQSRLRPGIYTRKKQNGELEAQFNIKRGTGIGYRITFDPQTSLYKLNIGQSNINLYTVLHNLGIKDEELEKAWGKEILDINREKYDAKNFDKLYDKIVLSKDKKGLTKEEKIKDLIQAFNNQKVDKDILQSTLI